MKAYQPDWSLLDAPMAPDKPPPPPLTAMEFKRLSSMLSVVMRQPNTETRRVSAAMRQAAPERRLAGPEPLPPFSPIAMAALPRLRSLGR